MHDYIPNQDSEFTPCLNGFHDMATTDMAALGLSVDDLTEIDEVQTDWDSAYSSHLAEQAAALDARDSKATARKAIEMLIRPMVERIQAHSGVTNE